MVPLELSQLTLASVLRPSLVELPGTCRGFLYEMMILPTPYVLGYMYLFIMNGTVNFQGDFTPVKHQKVINMNW